MNNKIISPSFYTESGKLTAYAFACGYCEKSNVGDNSKTLYKEHTTYHVVSIVNGKREWLSFDTLFPAYKKYNSIKL